jgi:hypothetical protein
MKCQRPGLAQERRRSARKALDPVSEGCFHRCGFAGDAVSMGRGRTTVCNGPEHFVRPAVQNWRKIAAWGENCVSIFG